MQLQLNVVRSQTGPELRRCCKPWLHEEDGTMALSRIRVMIAHPTPLMCAGLKVALGAHGDFEIVSPDSPPGSMSPMDSQIGARGVVVVTDCDRALDLTLSGQVRAGRLLIVTQDESEAGIRRAMEAGIRGYLLLTSSLESVLQAIRSVHRGGTALDPIVAAKVVESFVGDSLTRREMEVLRLLMLGLGDKGIAKRLARSVGTVKTHLKALRAKLKASSRTEAIAIAQRRGLVSGVDTKYRTVWHEIVSSARSKVHGPRLPRGALAQAQDP